MNPISIMMAVVAPTLTKRHARAIAAIVPTAALASCATSHYRGDGKFVDHGPFAAKDRYVLDLGNVELGRPGKYTYRIGNLPPTEFVIGLEVVEVQPNSSIKPRPPRSGSVRLVAETLQKGVVIAEDAPLNVWESAYGEGDVRSFLYRRG